jgi:hypothetical protein
MLLALLFMGIVALSPLNAQILDNEYYPLAIGSAWHYKSNDTKVTLKVTKHEKVGDKLCAVIETLRDGKVEGTECVSVSQAGAIRVSFNGQAASVPLMFLKFPPKKGEKWKVDSMIGSENVKGEFTIEEEKIKVPQGEYDTIKSVGAIEVNGQATTIAYWFAKNVGVVKLLIKTAESEVVLELEKYEAAKP